MVQMRITVARIRSAYPNALSRPSVGVRSESGRQQGGPVRGQNPTRLQRAPCIAGKPRLLGRLVLQTLIPEFAVAQRYPTQRSTRPECLLQAIALPLLAPMLMGQAFGQPINGSSLSHQSTGTAIGSALRLDENGYLGAYFTLDQPGQVTIDVAASGVRSDRRDPRMGIAVADQLVEFDVAAGVNQYTAAYDLPAGTYFMRTQLSNAEPGSGRSLTVNSVNIQQASSISNVPLSNRAVNEANALAAADTYIEHFRQGPATLALAGAAPGASVEVRMLRNEFNFGTYVTGFNADVWVGQLAPGETTTDRARYQDFVTRHFNMLVPSNMGKWQPTENFRGVPTMNNVDVIINFAAANNMTFRQHNLAWGNQQPGWVNNLIDDALAGDAQAKTELRQALIDRIRYYVGDGDADQSDGDRARAYVELDVVNEILREKTYYNIFGNEGLAEIYKLTKDAVEAAGAETLLMTNEYNVFNFAGDPFTGVSDNYANWYRQHVEDLNNAGYGQVVTGIGIQAQTNPAPDGSPTSGQNHNPARMNQVLQNMAVTGLPVTLTEFSVPAEAFGVVTTPERAAEVYSETLRMMYGAPHATSMLIWEAWPPLATDITNIVDANWNLTPVGEAFVGLMEAWTTPAQFLTVGADGAVGFGGHYGQYEVVVDGQTFLINHDKHTPVHALVTAAFLPGDYNRDGIVDAADYTVWRDSLGQPGLVPYSGPDGDGNGLIDLEDYLLWKANFGRGSAAIASASVPEPLAWRLLALAGVASLGRRLFGRRAAGPLAPQSQPRTRPMLVLRRKMVQSCRKASGCDTAGYTTIQTSRTCSREVSHAPRPDGVKVGQSAAVSLLLI